MTALPAVLYYSASLAEHLNATDEVDPLHGLIDATVATVLTAWTDNHWSVLPGGMPGDARRLVLDLPGQLRTEWGVSWAEGDEVALMRPWVAADEAGGR